MFPLSKPFVTLTTCEEVKEVLIEYYKLTFINIHKHFHCLQEYTFTSNKYFFQQTSHVIHVFFNFCSFIYVKAVFENKSLVNHLLKSPCMNGLQCVAVSLSSFWKH